jgi:hypothetical protein
MVFTAAGWITIQDLKFANTFTEGLSSSFSVTLVAFSVMFPVCIGLILYHFLLRKKQPFLLLRGYGKIVEGVYGVNDNHYDMVIMTVLF